MRVLTNKDLDLELDPEVKEILSFLHFHHNPKSSNFESLEWGNGLKPKSFVEKPLELELKPLISNFKHVFLNPPSFLPIMITTCLHETKEEKLSGSKGQQGSLWVERSWHKEFGPYYLHPQNQH